MAKFSLAPFYKDLGLGWALREAWREGYTRKSLIADLQAGVIVGIVALPLAMALAIASGVAPQQGLYTIIIGGALVALFGGSRYQVTGPTAAFVVLLLPVVQKFGLSGLLIAGFLAGIFCLLYGILRLGDIIQYVPHPVTTGFTCGIALVIAVIQIKDFFGLSIAQPSSDFIHRLVEIGSTLNSMQLREVIVGATTLALLILASKKFPRIPAPIFAISAVTIVTVILQRLLPDFSIATITSRFEFLHHGQIEHGIPRGLPGIQWPWRIHDPNTQDFAINWISIKEILPSAFAISLLGSIESLLSAVVADGMTRKKHNPNAELVALGIGNMITPFFGGIPATGAIARTSTNIRFGAVSPLAGVFHAAFIALVLLLLAPAIGYVPMAALAALLMFVAWNMAERRHFFNILRKGQLDDRLVLLTCFSLTVLFDMTVGVGAGIILSSTLFIRRIALLTQADVVQNSLHTDTDQDLPLGSHVFYYRIRGSLFFGAAERAMHRLPALPANCTHAIIDLDDVHFIDMTGLVALDSALKTLVQRKLKVAIVAPYPAVRAELLKLDLVATDVQLSQSRLSALRWANPT